MPFTPKNILILDSVDSTNNYAMALLQKTTEEAADMVFALEQTEGKGRRGRQWESHKGENIILSIPLQMQWLPVSRQFELSVAVALGCLDLFTDFIPGKVFIKWPNDIFINDTKAGGVLIENVIKGTLWQWTVIGIGLNINQENFERLNKTATSLKLVTGKRYNVFKLADKLYTFILARIDFLKSGDFEKLLQEYNDHLFAKDKIVKLQKQNIVFETKITGVSSFGELITQDAMERRFSFDEVDFKGLI